MDDIKDTPVLDPGQRIEGHNYLPWHKRTLDETTYSETEIYNAQALFMNYVPITEIHHLTGITLRMLRHYAYREDDNAWVRQRRKLEESLNEAIKEKALSTLKRINRISLGLIERGLTKIALDHDEAKTAPSLGELVAIADIWTKIHRGKVVEEAMGSDEENQGINQEEILSALTDDPYFGQAVISHIAKKERMKARAIDVTEENDPVPNNE